jgi:hypothetical protein
VVAAQADPDDDRQLALIGAVRCAGHGSFDCQGVQRCAQIDIARLTIA